MFVAFYDLENRARFLSDKVSQSFSIHLFLLQVMGIPAHLGAIAGQPFPPMDNLEQPINQIRMLLDC